jgi:hypothetical protein
VIEERIGQCACASEIPPTAQPKKSQVVTDILLLREISHVDLGVDVVIAEPHS